MIVSLFAAFVLPSPVVMGLYDAESRRLSIYRVSAQGLRKVAEGDLPALVGFVRDVSSNATDILVTSKTGATTRVDLFAASQGGIVHKRRLTAPPQVVGLARGPRGGFFAVSALGDIASIYPVLRIGTPRTGLVANTQGEIRASSTGLAAAVLTTAIGDDVSSSIVVGDISGKSVPKILAAGAFSGYGTPWTDVEFRQNRLGLWATNESGSLFDLRWNRVKGFAEGPSVQLPLKGAIRVKNVGSKTLILDRSGLIVLGKIVGRAWRSLDKVELPLDKVVDVEWEWLDERTILIASADPNRVWLLPIEGDRLGRPRPVLASPSRREVFIDGRP